MCDKRKFINIGRPYIEELSLSRRLCARIHRRKQSEIMWFSVDEKYGTYLTFDRSDAFVAGILTTAMRDDMDIVCEAPITKRLLYQLNHYLIPMMAANMEEYHLIRIIAEEMDTAPECAGAVATGWTGGVDSMYTLMRSLRTERKNHKLTHLLITNNGALEGDHKSELLKQLVQKAEKNVACERNLSVIGVDTNLQEMLSEKFLAVASFRHAAVVLSLQKLFGIFLFSAAYEFSKFSFDVHNCFYYELVSFACFETNCTVFYSAYGAFSRVRKLRELSELPLAQQLLHPCIYASDKNCGRCGKCIRTEAVLYGLGTLDKFSAVFDVDEFERNKDWYMANILAKKESQHYGEALMLLRRRGVELSVNAKRMARMIRAADTIVNKNKEWMIDKLIGE